MRPRFTRRGFLASALLAAAMPRAAYAAEPRLAVIDWGLLETALAIGVVPAAGTELIQYRKIVVEPAVPEETVDLGLRGTPNYELLRLIAPDLIVISGFYEYQRGSLERVAPVVTLPIYEAGQPPFPLAELATAEMGRLTDRTETASAYIAETAAMIAQARTELRPLADRPVFVINLGDSRHFRAFGADSMLGDVLARLGLRNAWTIPTSYSAAAPVGLEALAQSPDAAIVILAPLPPEVERTLSQNALWNALPAVKQGRVAVLDPINHFGGLPSARRFTRLLTKGAADWGRNG